MKENEKKNMEYKLEKIQKKEKKVMGNDKAINDNKIQIIINVVYLM
jgi:hypothetical protein